MNDPSQQWQKLVEAARRSRPPEPVAKAPPPGFASRIVSLRESIIAFARVLFWRRWSLGTALLSFLVFLAILATHRCTESRPPLIDTPDSLPPTP